MRRLGRRAVVTFPSSASHRTRGVGRLLLPLCLAVLLSACATAPSPSSAGVLAAATAAPAPQPSVPDPVIQPVQPIEPEPAVAPATVPDVPSAPAPQPEIPAPTPIPPPASTPTPPVTVPAAAPPPTEPTEGELVAALVADLGRYPNLSPEDVRRETNAVTQALTRQRTDANRVRLAVLYTLAHTREDDQRALQLLETVAKSNPGSPAIKGLAGVIQAQINERLRAVREEQQKADVAIQKLEALRVLERSLLRDRLRSGGGGTGGGSGGGSGGGH